MTDFPQADRLLYLKSHQSTLLKFLLAPDREIVGPLEFYVLTSNTRRTALLLYILTGANDSLVIYYFCLERDLQFQVVSFIDYLIIIIITLQREYVWSQVGPVLSSCQMTPLC